MQAEQFDLALSLMKDDMAEPYRHAIITGIEQAKKALPECGAELISISGAGPTLFTICKTKQAAEQCQAWLNEHYINEHGFSHICKLDQQGTRAISQGE